MKIKTLDWRIIWFFFKPYKLQCLSVIVLMFVSGFLEMLNLVALYPMINNGLNLEKNNAFLQHFATVADYIKPDNPFFASCIILMIVSVFAITFKFLYSYVSNKLTVRMVGDMQKKMFEKLMAADYDFYVKSQQGELIYAGTVAPERTSLAIFSTLLFIYQTINGIFLFSILMLLSWQGTAAILALGFIYTMTTKEVSQRIVQKCAFIRVEESQKKNVVLNEFISGIKSIKIFLASGQWQQRHNQAVDRTLSNQFRMMMAGIVPEALVKFIFFIFLALTGIYLSQRPQLEIISMLPLFGIFIVIVTRFLPAVNGIGSSLMKVAECMPDTKIVYEFCREEFVVAPDGEKELTDFKDKITFEHVSFKYKNMSENLLQNLSFSIERRKMTALVGFSGSGKTTIINLLLRLYRPDSGAIKIDGVDIVQLNNKTYLNKVGYVSQETFIFNSSIWENIRFGLENCSDEMIEEAATLANAHEFIVETPQGYQTIVGDSGVKLSGGQRQRIAIARAMLRKPEIIIFDEATSSLDNISEKKIQKAINNISKHTTVLVIAHRLSTVQHADKIIILEKGEIKEQGTHEELLGNKKLYYDLYMSSNAEEGNLAQERIEL